MSSSFFIKIPYYTLMLNRTPKGTDVFIRKVPPLKIFHNQSPNNKLNEAPKKIHGRMS